MTLFSEHLSSTKTLEEKSEAVYKQIAYHTAAML